MLRGRKRLASIAALAAAAAMSIAASASAATSATTIHFWSWDPNMSTLVSAFNKSHPSIKVVLSDINPEYAKLSAAISAGNPPDVAQIEYQALPQYIATGSLENLTSAGFAKYKSDYPSWAWSEVTEGGGLWALPEDAGPTVMFYRKDLFKKYHLAIPTTWAQFASEAKSLHKAHPGVYLTDFAPNDPSWLLGLMAQNGASWFGTAGNAWTVSIDDPASVKVAQYWQGLLDAKAVGTDPDFAASFWHDFTNGSVLTWISGGWAADLLTSEAPSTSGKWGVVQMPNWSKAASANIGGSTDVIFKASKDQAADDTFLAWLNANESTWTDLYSDVHLVPAYTPAYKLSAVNAKVKFFGGEDLAPVFKTATSRVNEKFTWSPITEALYTEASDDFGSVINGKGTLMSSLSSLQTWAVKTMKSNGFSVKS